MLLSPMPPARTVSNRLLRNPTDFARVLRRFYGKESACEFERLVTDHLKIAAELVKAAKARNVRAAVDAERRWYANAEQIACFQNRINPNWPFRRMRAMWFEHLSLTKDEAVAELTGNYTASIGKFNRIEREALMMADVFSNGIFCQFCNATHAR